MNIAKQIHLKGRYSWFKSMSGSFHGSVVLQRFIQAKTERDQERAYAPRIVVEENTEWTFWNTAGVGVENECWEWQGQPDRDGYGYFRYLGKRWRAHRLAYHFAHGDVSPGAVVRHTCDNPLCCNPRHLIAGTQRDNISDRDQRGRQARGSQNGRAKLTEEIVLQLRAQSMGRRGESVRLAREFGINLTIVRDILAWRTWRHIQPHVTHSIS